MGSINIFRYNKCTCHPCCMKYLQLPKMRGHEGWSMGYSFSFMGHAAFTVSLCGTIVKVVTQIRTVGIVVTRYRTSVRTLK